MDTFSAGIAGSTAGPALSRRWPPRSAYCRRGFCSTAVAPDAGRRFFPLRPEESEIYSNKDLADLYALAHKMRMDEMKAQTELEKAKASQIKTQNNVQINAEVPFGQGNYGELMKKLLDKK